MGKRARNRFFTILLLVASPAMSEVESEHLQTELHRLIEAYHLPALGVIAERDGEILARSVGGVRSIDADTEATIADMFHIGSITKSMTATLAALMVQDNEIEFQTTVRSVFPEARGAVGTATLEDLLRHRSGATASIPDDFPDLWQEMYRTTDDLPSMRRRLVQRIANEENASARTGRYLYSNAGYVIAGTMLEAKANRSWESMMRSRLFGPLEMNCGFGVSGVGHLVDQPWPHWTVEGRLKAQRIDNPPSLGPAGTVHCDLDSLASYARFHLSGIHNGERLLNADLLRQLHTPWNEVGMGWGVARDGSILGANGNNNLNHARILIYPGQRAFMVLVTNRGDPEAIQAIDRLEQIVHRFLFSD